MTRNLKAALRKQKKQTKQEILQIPGSLGIPIGGQRRVEVPNRNSFVYVRLRDNQNEVIQAFNNKVAPSYGLPVIVERKGNRYFVVSVDDLRYQNNWNSFSPYLPRHGNTHSFDMESGGGGDIVWVHTRQFMPALIMPSGSTGGPNVIMNAYTLKNEDGSWKHVGPTGTQNLTPYIPPVSSQAVMTLVYLDSVSGNPYLMVGSGSYFSNTITGSAAVLPYVPSITNPLHIPLAAVRLVSGTSVISWNNIYDVRQFLHTIPTGTSSGSGNVSGVSVWDEGVPLGLVNTLNFVGQNVDVSVSGTVARVHITGSSGGVSNLTGTFIGSPSHVVLTNSSGYLDTQAGLKWGFSSGRLFIQFGADVPNQETNAGKIGYNLFSESSYLHIVGAGTGTNARNVKIYDNLYVNSISNSQYFRNTSFNTAWPYVDNTGLYVGPTNAPEHTTITGSYQVLGLSPANVSSRFTINNLLDDVGSAFLIPLNGWIPKGEVWTRVSNTQFTVSGDVTAVYRKGAKVRYEISSSYGYSVIASSSHAAGTTTVDLIPTSDYGMSSSPTGRWLSYIENPEGFPDWFNYTTSWTSTSSPQPSLGNGSLSGKWKATGKQIDFQIYLVGGNTTTFGTDQWRFTVPVAMTSSSTGYEIGIIYALDSGTMNYYGFWYSDTTTTIGVLRDNTTTPFGASVPFTWTTNDILSIKGTYQF